MEAEPARLELTIAADGPTQGQMEISNPAPKAAEVRIHTGPYRFLDSGIRMPSAQAWLTFEPDSFTLAPGASTTVQYTVIPPENIPRDTAGEYVAAILIDELPLRETGDKRQETGGRISIVPRLALPVYLQIQGRQLRQVEVGEVVVRADRLLRIETTLHNRGSVHVRPTGTLAVFDQATGALIRGAPLGKSLPLLPAASLTLPVVMPLPGPGRYRVVVTVEPFEGEMLQREASFEVTEAAEVIQR